MCNRTPSSYRLNRKIEPSNSFRFMFNYMLIFKKHVSKHTPRAKIRWKQVDFGYTLDIVLAFCAFVHLSIACSYL